MIPGFNISNVLPPFTGRSSADQSGLSPYKTSILDVVHRFNTSPERQAILRGLLSYRNALGQAGMTSGSQWLDGSFVENVELTRGRPPGDIDLVTVATLPGATQAEKGAFIQANLNLFDPAYCKHNFSVDAYFIDLAKPAPFLVEDVVYWYGLFSHQKGSSLWKGMLMIPLNQVDDAAALAAL